MKELLVQYVKRVKDLHRPLMLNNGPTDSSSVGRLWKGITNRPRKEAIMIELTEQQRQAVKNGEAVHVPAPEIGEDVVLLTAKLFDNMCESLEDQREQKAILRYTMKQAQKVAQENPY